MSLPELFTVEEAAARIRREPQWLARAAAKGQVPSRKIGHRRFFTEADLEEYLESTREGTPANTWGMSPQQRAAAARRPARAS